MRTLFYFKCSMHVLHLQQINKRTIMKYLFVALLLIATFVFPSSIYAHKIALFHKSKNDAPTWPQKGKRSINYLPSIIQNDNTLYIYSDIPMEDAMLTIKDEYNNIIISSTITVFPNQGSTFILTIDSGNYIIELEYEDNYYYGYFEVTQ